MPDPGLLGDPIEAPMRDRQQEQGAQRQFHPEDLGQEDGGDDLIERRARHVDGGAHRNDELRDGWTDAELVLDGADGQWQRPSRRPATGPRGGSQEPRRGDLHQGRGRWTTRPSGEHIDAEAENRSRPCGSRAAPAGRRRRSRAASADAFILRNEPAMSNVGFASAAGIASDMPMRIAKRQPHAVAQRRPRRVGGNQRDDATGRSDSVTPSAGIEATTSAGPSISALDGLAIEIAPGRSPVPHCGRGRRGRDSATAAGRRWTRLDRDHQSDQGEKDPAAPASRRSTRHRDRALGDRTEPDALPWGPAPSGWALRRIGEFAERLEVEELIRRGRHHVTPERPGRRPGVPRRHTGARSPMQDSNLRPSGCKPDALAI